VAGVPVHCRQHAGSFQIGGFAEMFECKPEGLFKLLGSDRHSSPTIVTTSFHGPAPSAFLGVAIRVGIRRCAMDHSTRPIPGEARDRRPDDSTGERAFSIETSPGDDAPGMRAHRRVRAPAEAASGKRQPHEVSVAVGQDAA
jgi:hypothetical protein